MSDRVSAIASAVEALVRPALRTGLRRFVRPVLSPGVPFALQRTIVEAVTRLSAPVPADVRVTFERLGSVAGERALPADAREDVALLYLHGGGFCIGSPAMHRSIGARLARACRAPVYVADYRRAPEHPYPAALDDALETYDDIVRRGFAPDRIALAGDSAGGGLVLALLVALRERGSKIPASAVLFSPWVDCALRGATLAADDPVVDPAWLERCARAYRGALAADDPRVSPLYARFEGLPPLAIFVGTREVLLDDAARLAERTRSAGIDVTYVRYDGLWHNAQFQASLLSSARASFDDAARFVEAAWSGRSTAY